MIFTPSAIADPKGSPPSPSPAVNLSPPQIGVGYRLGWKAPRISKPAYVAGGDFILRNYADHVGIEVSRGSNSKTGVITLDLTRRSCRVRWTAANINLSIGTENAFQLCLNPFILWRNIGTVGKVTFADRARPVLGSSTIFVIADKAGNEILAKATAVRSASINDVVVDLGAAFAPASMPRNLGLRFAGGSVANFLQATRQIERSQFSPATLRGYNEQSLG